MKLIRDDFAVYLPAVNTLFADALVKPIPNGRPFPDNLSLDDLKFWQPKNPLWHHPHFFIPSANIRSVALLIMQ